jgi:hypothetical protein
MFLFQIETMWLDTKKLLMEFFPILVLSMALVDASNANEVRPTKCKPGQFFKIAGKGAGKCTKCSDCPPNHMIVQPCGGLKDSRCEAFMISKFNIGPSGDDGNIVHAVDEDMTGEVGCKNKEKGNFNLLSFLLVGM